MAEVVCFWIEQNGWTRVYARRYVPGATRPCGLGGRAYCNAKELQAVVLPDERLSSGSPTDRERGTFVWPETCEGCGEPFQEGDTWQRFCQYEYVRPDTGEKMSLLEAPPGAMFRVPWFEDIWKGPDEQCLAVKLPLVSQGQAEEWIIDGPASNGSGPPPHWQRTGIPPKLTVTPSIGRQDSETGAFRYHGWLRDGVLVDA